MFRFLLPLVVIGLLVFFAKQLFGGEHKAPRDPNALRFGFLFGLCGLGWILTAAGVSTLVRSLLADDALYRDTSAELASAISLLVIGLPLAIGLWIKSKGLIEDAPGAWTLAHLAVSSVALIVALSTVGAVLVGFTNGELSKSTGMAVAWSALWWACYRVERKYPTRLGLSRLAWSGISMAVLFGTSVWFLSLLFDRGLAAITNSTLADSSQGLENLADPILWLIPAAFVWTLAWLRDAARGPESGFRTGYCLIGGVALPTTIAIGSSAVILFLLAEWWIGSPEAATLAKQLEPAPVSLALAIVGIASALHHRRILAMPSPADRGARAMLAAIGAIAGATGIASVVSAGLYAVSPGTFVDETFDLALGGVIAALIGGGLWWSQWLVMQRRAADDPVELVSPSRRTMISILVGLSILAAIPAFIAVVYGLLMELLDGESFSLMRTLAPSLGILAGAGVLGGYHWSVLHSDRGRAPVVTAEPELWLLVISAADPAAVRSATAVAEQVSIHQRTDLDPGTVGDLEAVVQGLTDGLCLLLQHADGSWETIPLDARGG